MDFYEQLPAAKAKLVACTILAESPPSEVVMEVPCASGGAVLEVPIALLPRLLDYYATVSQAMECVRMGFSIATHPGCPSGVDDFAKHVDKADKSAKYVSDAVAVFASLATLVSDAESKLRSNSWAQLETECGNRLSLTLSAVRKWMLDACAFLRVARDAVLAAVTDHIGTATAVWCSSAQTGTRTSTMRPVMTTWRRPSQRAGTE